MKKSGFRASYAGAIEACASTGAVLAPPVMGATAFVIAQFLNVSYADVAVAAIIPAALYYVGLFMQVDSYAARHGLKGIPRAELPKIMDTIKDGWYYIFVIALLIVMLLYFKRESHAPFYATALLLVLNQLFSKETRWTLATISKFLEVNGRTFVELVGILAGCGLLIGAFSMTGVVSSLANDLLRIAGDNRVPAARHVRLHQPHSRPRADDDGLLHLPRHPGGAGTGKARPQPHGRAHVHLLLGHAVVDHAAGRHRLLCRGRHRRLAGDEDGLGIDVGRQHHLFHPVLLRAEPGAGAAGPQSVSRRARADGAGGFRHAVHLRRHSGLSGLRRRLARRRRAGMAAAGAAGDRRLRGGNARRRHHAAVADAGHIARPRHSGPDGLGRAAADPPPKLWCRASCARRDCAAKRGR